MPLSQPPRKDNPRFDDWVFRLWKETQTGATEGASDHAALQNLNSDNYTHLTGANAAALTGGADTDLHYHSADRNRANHTGTQPSSTISDFASAVQALQGSSILESQVFGA